MKHFGFSNLMVALGLVILSFAITGTMSDIQGNADLGESLQTTISEKTDLTQPSLDVKQLPTPTTIEPTQDTENQALETFTVPSRPAAPAALIPVTGPVYIPDRIRIPKIGLDAPVVESDNKVVTVDGQSFEQWLAPDKRAAGWHTSSATLGVPGNTVLNGHHNVYGEVFGRLVDLDTGDMIIVSSGDQDFIYKITNKMILPEKYAELDVREENARWLQPSEDERLTLVTCWPKVSNTHRLIIVAKPVAQGVDPAGFN